MEYIYSQNPQCEGVHQDRQLFDAKLSSPAPIQYRARYNPYSNAVVVDAGIAHGVSDGAEFTIRVAQELNPHHDGNLLGTYIVVKATPFNSIMKPPGGLSISALSSPSGIVAFQTKRGLGNPLRLFVPEPSDRLTPPSHRDDILRACGHDFHFFRFVDSRDNAHLELAAQENDVVITIRDMKTTQQGHFILPTKKVAWDKLGPFLRKAQSFYRELDRSSSDIDVTKDIGMEFYKLQETLSFFGDISEPGLGPSGDNLFRGGVIEMVVEAGGFYGVKLTNNGVLDLYPTLFYFDSSDLTRIRESLPSYTRI